MKTLLYTVLLSFLLFAFNAPLNNGCLPPTAMIELDVNQVSATLLTGGDLWWNRSDGKYNVPKDAPNGVSALFAGGLWVAGVDPGGNLRIAAQTYGGSSGNGEFWAGPLDPETGTTHKDLCEQFDRFWETNRADIDSHISDFEDNGVIDGPIPVSIRSWPGRGNPEFSQIFGWTLPSQDLAPFVDRNGDSIYNPQDGDFPKIKGDQAIWWVMNDEGGGNIHPTTQGQSVKVEVQAMAYACSSPGNALDHTTFYEFTYINRALEDLDDTYITLWVDPDLGCYLDDYIGSNPGKKMAIVYNMDEEDGQPGSDCAGGVPTYGSDIPMLGIQVLDGAINHLGQDVGFSSFMYSLNSFGLPAPTWDPNTAIEYYNYMKGLWLDGTPLTKGGNGYNPGSTDTVSYAFPDSPDDINGWSMCSESIPASDMRFMINSGPFYLKASGGQTTITYAVITQLSADYPCPSFETLSQMSEEIKGVCDGVTSTKEVVFDDFKIQLFPNPMDEYSIVKLNDQNEVINEIRLHDANGKLIQTHSDLKSTEYKINRNNMPAGVYYLKIMTNEKLWFSKKMVIY